MIEEPPVPKNKKCVVCGKKLDPISGPGKGSEDAFCSTACCREYFGNVDEIANPVASANARGE